MVTDGEWAEEFSDRLGVCGAAGTDVAEEYLAAGRVRRGRMAVEAASAGPLALGRRGGVGLHLSIIANSSDFEPSWGSHPWRTEEAIKLAKSACGLADYEVRSCHGWYRHIILAQPAAAFLAVQDVVAREQGPRLGVLPSGGGTARRPHRERG